MAVLPLDDAARSQWAVEFPGDSSPSYRNWKTNLVRTWRGRSVMLHIEAVITCYSQTERSRVNQYSLFSSLCPQELDYSTFSLVFFFSFSDSVALLRDTHNKACQSWTEHGNYRNNMYRKCHRGMWDYEQLRCSLLVFVATALMMAAVRKRTSCPEIFNSTNLLECTVYVFDGISVSETKTICLWAWKKSVALRSNDTVFKWNEPYV